MPAALPAVAPIPVISSTERGAMLRDILQVAEKDYLHVLRTLSLQEIGQQIRLGNPPSAVLVDGRRGISVEQARRAVVAWFADRKTLADAIIAARNELVRTGRTVTGKTVSEAQFYYSVGRTGEPTRTSDPRGIAMSVPNPSSLDLFVVVLAPHVRKWHWLTRSGARGLRRTRSKKLRGYMKFLGQKRAPMVSQSVFERVEMVVERKFRSVNCDYIFLETPNLNPGGRTAVNIVPAIKVCMKIRGRGR